MTPGEAVEGQHIQADVVQGDTYDSGLVQCDWEPTKENCEHGNKVEHWDGQGSGEV